MNSRNSIQRFALLLVVAITAPVSIARPIQVDNVLWPSQGPTITYNNPGFTGNTLNGLTFCSNASSQVWWGQGPCGVPDVYVQLLSFDFGSAGSFLLPPAPIPALGESMRFRVSNRELPDVPVPFFGDISFNSAHATGGVAGDFDFSVGYGCLPFNGNAETNPCKNIVEQYRDLLGQLSSSELEDYLRSVEYGSGDRQLVLNDGNVTRFISTGLNSNSFFAFCYRQNNGNPFFGTLVNSQSQCAPSAAVSEPPAIGLMLAALMVVGLLRIRKGWQLTTV